MSEMKGSQTISSGIPERRMILMGNGKPVRPKTIAEFCNSIVDRCLDGQAINCYEFVLGFAACLDAVARGTIDMDEDPLGVARQAWHDVHNVLNKQNIVTDIMRLG